MMQPEKRDLHLYLSHFREHPPSFLLWNLSEEMIICLYKLNNCVFQALTLYHKTEYRNSVSMIYSSHFTISKCWKKQAAAKIFSVKNTFIPDGTTGKATATGAIKVNKCHWGQECAQSIFCLSLICTNGEFVPMTMLVERQALRPSVRPSILWGLAE